MVNGAHTQVGEKGMNLCGGQRAWVCLARALYSRADLYLLDDPLSAVDPVVLARLVDWVLLGYLKSKTRILVTNHLQLLPHADKILVLKEGSAVFYGTYNELVERNLDLEISEQQSE